MNNELIPTNGLWYRIKHFFRSIFSKEKEIEIKANNSFQSNYSKITIINNDSLKEKYEIENKKQALAEKLVYGEINTSELTENEVDEMTDYFTKDIQNIDSELLRIKQHILAMQKELKQE